MSSSSSTSSLPSLDVSISSNHTSLSGGNGVAGTMRMGNSTTGPSPTPKTHDFYIIRVTYETDSVETDGKYLY